ncbi:hypothetical protein [Dictyobacter kobayashii]|uniref:Uncharacterized protein n=1 Tax=Dictyobacter kobayashii TaxID=2014872 RepID=A0A402AD22_9CHLR|nr:hypothetical protein [Dictyobacter kobayashii]GCE16983.1 hypothetical protein KDK_07830 [Dictyobacter kobayashii]
MFSINLVVEMIRLSYERSCPFLTIKPLYDKKKMPVDLARYVKQFWGSERKNKATAQGLVSKDDLLIIAKKFDPHINEETLRRLLSELIQIGVFWSLEIDVNGAVCEKLVLAPLGLALWKNIDGGAIFNQVDVSFQHFQQILTKDKLFEILEYEKIAWIDLHHPRLSSSSGSISPQLVCLGLYLLLNGAITQNCSLHLVRTTNKNFQWHETLVKGLNTIAQTLFEVDDLFKEHSLKDDLQRRSGLINKVGSSFKWLKPKRGQKTEYYWWEIGNYKQNQDVLNYIVRTLISAIPVGDKYQPINDRLQVLIKYFCDRVGYTLPFFEMSQLFPLQPDQDYSNVLQFSIENTLRQITET